MNCRIGRGAPRPRVLRVAGLFSAARSSRMIKGAVDWSSPKSVAGSMWFPKYKTKVMGAIQAEAQRKGVKYIEMVAIAGGPVSQLERRTMPSIISGSVNDLRKKGLNIALAGSADFDRDPQSTQIVVFLTTVTFDQFFERFRSDQVQTHARGFQEEISVDIEHGATSLDVTEQASKTRRLSSRWWPYLPMMPNLQSLNLGGVNVGPKECTWLAAAIPTMAALTSLDVFGNTMYSARKRRAAEGFFATGAASRLEGTHRVRQASQPPTDPFGDPFCRVHWRRPPRRYLWRLLPFSANIIKLCPESHRGVAEQPPFRSTNPAKSGPFSSVRRPQIRHCELALLWDFQTKYGTGIVYCWHGLSCRASAALTSLTIAQNRP